MCELITVRIFLISMFCGVFSTYVLLRRMDKVVSFPAIENNLYKYKGHSDYHCPILTV